MAAGLPYGYVVRLVVGTLLLRVLPGRAAFLAG